MFERLHPPGEPVDALEALAATRPWERAHSERPLVLVNMVSSLDGRVTVDGGSSGLGGEGDKAMFHALRTVVDAVLSGTGTMRAEQYGRLVRSAERRARREALGLAGDPVAVVLSRSGDVPWDAPLFASPEQRVLVAGPAEPPEGVAATVEVLDVAEPTPAAALRELHRRGIRSVLCEGGPTLNRALVGAGVADELFLTLAPQLVGGAGSVLRVLAGEELPEPTAARLRWVLRHGDELFLRYSLRP